MLLKSEIPALVAGNADKAKGKTELRSLSIPSHILALRNSECRVGGKELISESGRRWHMSWSKCPEKGRRCHVESGSDRKVLCAPSGSSQRSRSAGPGTRGLWDMPGPHNKAPFMLPLICLFSRNLPFWALKAIFFVWWLESATTKRTAWVRGVTSQSQFMTEEGMHKGGTSPRQALGSLEAKRLPRALSPYGLSHQPGLGGVQGCDLWPGPASDQQGHDPGVCVHLPPVPSPPPLLPPWPSPSVTPLPLSSTWPLLQAYPPGIYWGASCVPTRVLVKTSVTLIISMHFLGVSCCTVFMLTNSFNPQAALCGGYNNYLHFTDEMSQRHTENKSKHEDLSGDG